MMFVIFDPATGEVLATSAGALPPRSGQYVELPEAELGDLTAWRVVEGALVHVSIEPARARAIARVNTTIGDIRARFVTVIPGQEMIYLQKEAEAVAYLAAAAPAAADFPFMSAEVGITAQTAYQVAQVYTNQAALLKSVAAQLETARLGTIAALEGATAEAEIDAAMAAFWIGLSGFTS